MNILFPAYFLVLCMICKLHDSVVYGTVLKSSRRAHTSAMYIISENIANYI